MKNVNCFLYCFFLIITNLTYSQNNTPNVLLIIADDMGIDITNGYQQNTSMPTTPTLDSLRANGITYKNTWSAPSCTPTRAAIMSGKYGIKTGVMRAPGNLDLSHTSLFNTLSSFPNDLYAKAVIGKWHISNPVDYNHPQQHGINHYEGLFTAMADDYYDWEKVTTSGSIIRESEYVTSNLTNAAKNWVNSQNQPWFLWLAHVAPHGPYHVPPSEMYSINSTVGQLNKYIAAIEAMDYQIGKLLNSFDEDTKKNTIIIFIGDNGTPPNVVQYFDSNHTKGSLYEGGIRVPMIISGKGVSRINEEENGLTHVADIHATIVELTGHQLKGGIHNSLSLKPSLSCANQIKRNYLYSDFEDSGILSWAIRNNQYKLIEDENGNQEFYDIVADLPEQNNLIGSLTTAQQNILTELSNEANTIRTNWSCADGISNGNETEIDDCNINCSGNNDTSTQNIGCCDSPTEPNAFYEFIYNGERNVYSNNFPDHDYCYNSASQMPEQKYHHFKVDLDPEITGTITKVVRDNGRPARFFGVAKNGVIMAPAPAQPFIFENPNTGEFNWDWVFEPTNNQGNGTDLVGLDCASAHTGGQGYHYHGNMFEYMEHINTGITTTSTPPTTPLHIGWAADGFPVLYRFGPDADGNIKELLPSYQLKQGERPGDGTVEPCGVYNGKYTNDYEYICGKGDLDECNGIASNITLTTANGTEIFEYFYVVTSSFPQISRCLVGNVSSDFDNGSTQPTGSDNDNDGYIEQFDCNDNDSNINPNVNGESPYIGNCSPLSTPTFISGAEAIKIGPNPSNGNLYITYDNEAAMTVNVYNIKSQLIQKKKGTRTLSIGRLSTGFYFVKVKIANRKKEIIKKIIVK